MSECSRRLEYLADEYETPGAVVVCTYRAIRKIDGVDRKGALEIIESIFEEADRYI